MLQVAYDVAQWVVWVAGAIAVAALAVVVLGLAKRPRHLSILSIAAVIVAGGVCIASLQFLGTRVQQVTIGTVKQLGLEKDHAGLRSNALVYNIPVTVTASWNPPIIGGITKHLIYQTRTINSQVAVYSLVDVTKLAKDKATVDRQAKTITISLPDPVISQDTTYIWAVDGVQERTGVLNAIGQSLIGPFESLFGHSQVSFNINPELKDAESTALTRAQHSSALDSCGKQEIAQQLAAAFDLTPDYSGYTVHVNWAHPPATGVSCSGLQQQLSASGSGSGG
ncbi:MAG TPA: hypothetical protein VH478_01380 [Trebonia sp.]|jgi:hypothetical protein|nr:hypothetical protein [Trebonia sp.]